MGQFKFCSPNCFATPVGASPPLRISTVLDPMGSKSEQISTGTDLPQGTLSPGKPHQHGK